MDTARRVDQMITPELVMEGAGVLLRRSVAPRRENLHDPFLLFDHFAFNDPAEGQNPGFPMHPHRGIETVTYMREGLVNHRDSLGNAGQIGPGDVQWMTSGRGILHEEMPRPSPQGGVDGFQLWVNLPAARKMDAPNYQEVPAGSIPEWVGEGVRARVVAGEAAGIRGPVTGIAAAPIYLDVQIEAGARFTQAVPRGDTLLIYVYQGAGVFGVSADGADGAPVQAVQMLTFTDGDAVTVRADAAQAVRFLLMAGAPFGEPIVPYGPFVMNTREEIQQALQDLRSGTFVR